LQSNVPVIRVHSIHPRPGSLRGHDFPSKISVPVRSKIDLTGIEILLNYLSEKSIGKVTRKASIEFFIYAHLLM
jgi:hypothetical protein